MTRTITPEYLPTRAAAERIGVHSDTLCTWRKNGTGPAYVKLVGRILYRTAEVDAWLDSRTVQPEAVQ